MTDLYFGIKLIGGAIVIVLVALLVLVLFIHSLIHSYKENRIRKYLESIGYERELISTASVGTNHHYGYKRVRDDRHWDIIRDSELIGMSIKQVKKKYT